LREVGSHAFSGCTGLLSICLPASVARIQEYAFSGSGLVEIDVEPGNPFLGTQDGFLYSLNEKRLICYFGVGSHQQIPATIAILSHTCFLRDTRIQNVRFEAPANHLSIGGFASSSIVSICIPSSVQFLEDVAFRGCSALLVVTFEEPSQLVRIGSNCFQACRSLSSFSVPSSVEEICDFSFSECSRLPGLSFASPSHLRTLGCLPPVFAPFSRIDIPDSVEIIRARLETYGTPGNSLVLTFGNESRLRQMSVSHYFSSKQPRAYLLFSVPGLKVIRASLEFVARKGLSMQPRIEILDE
jgi:hypothetical protein